MALKMKIGSEPWKAYLRAGAADLGIELGAGHLDAFETHARELLFWNRRTNLTAITDPQQVASKHFLDSLVPSRWVPPEAVVLDVGSGGGFPGVPLKVLLPETSITLIDASRKKVSFLCHVIRLLGLSGVEAVHTRVEQMSDAAERRPGRPRFDVILSRAWGSLESLIPAILPLLAERGIVLSMRGKSPRAASAVGRRCGPMEVFDAYDYRLPGADGARSIWCLHLRT